MSQTSDKPKPRLRDLGITIGTMQPGEWNAITDVVGVRVGHTTIIRGEGPLRVGKGPVRTGVTAIHPHEDSAFAWQVPAAIDILNGAGEITGRSLVDEYGVLGSPILITNTLSVGEVHRATVEWMVRHHPEIGPRYWVAPVVAETYDGHLNDTAGQHIRREHVFAALDNAINGPVAEGNVGGGTGMMLFGMKGGIGTSSRRIEIDGHDYTVGVLIQGNFGGLSQLLVDGVPVGRELAESWPERRELPVSPVKLAQPAPSVIMSGREGSESDVDGSIIVVIATDAPLSDRQLGRLCRRGMLGLSRTGSTAQHGSGDLLLAFSNARENRIDHVARTPVRATVQLDDEELNPLFQATVEATEESVLNALVAAETLVGRDGNWAYALPHDRLREIMCDYGRLYGS